MLFFLTSLELGGGVKMAAAAYSEFQRPVDDRVDVCISGLDGLKYS